MSSEILTGILGKRYKLQSSDKFDDYMKALGEMRCTDFFFFFKEEMNSWSIDPVELYICIFFSHFDSFDYELVDYEFFFGTTFRKNNSIAFGS